MNSLFSSQISPTLGQKYLEWRHKTFYRYQEKCFKAQDVENFSQLDVITKIKRYLDLPIVLGLWACQKIADLGRYTWTCIASCNKKKPINALPPDRRLKPDSGSTSGQSKLIGHGTAKLLDLIVKTPQDSLLPDEGEELGS